MTSRTRSGLRAEFTASTGIPSTLAPRVQVELLRIISEALNNVRKHADATIVRVTAEVSDGELLITVTDNGRGFAQAEAFDRGMGLQGMRERARLIGGSLAVTLGDLAAAPPSRCARRWWRPGVGSVSRDQRAHRHGTRRARRCPMPRRHRLTPSRPATEPRPRRSPMPGTTSAPDAKPTGMQT